MCGIVGYIGDKNKAIDVVLDGLLGLEYRGYDSSGIAYFEQDKLQVEKQVGRVQTLVDIVKGNQASSKTAIGHTRWATHGKPSTKNSHPHCNQNGTIAVVHNGIIENHLELRARLEELGYKFASDTDTEVVAHLIDYYSKTSKSFKAAFETALRDLEGAYGLLVTTTLEPDSLYAAKLGSPLVIGLAKDGSYIASDASVLMDHTKEVIYLDDFEAAEIRRDGKYSVTNLKKSKAVKKSTETISHEVSKATLEDFPNFMLKEIYEAPETIRSATAGRLQSDLGMVKLDGLEQVAEQLRYTDRIVIVACGTSYYAGLVGEYLFEEIAGIPVEVQLASEFKYRNEPFSRSSVLLAISQSGETADTIAALKKVSGFGVLKLGIVNAVGSTIARITDAGVYCHAGQEKAVASTKAFIAQVSVLALMALHLSKKSDNYSKLLKSLDDLPTLAEAVFKKHASIKKIAHKYKDFRDFLYIGRGYGFPCALEGALKLKEISYIHAEGYAAGEMKHGPLAMIDKKFPTFAIALNDSLLEKNHSNIEEIRARGGPVVAVATQGDKKIAKLADDVIYIPKVMPQLSPILVAIVMQLFAYEIAIAKGLDVDKPRNLAKSVTVE